MDAKFGEKDKIILINALREIAVTDQKQLSKIAKSKIKGNREHDKRQ